VCPAGTDSTGDRQRSKGVIGNADRSRKEDGIVEDEDSVVLADEDDDVEYDMDFDDDIILAYSNNDDDDDDDDDYLGLADREDEGRKDNHKDCEMWALMEECIENPGYMLENCKQSCSVSDE